MNKAKPVLRFRVSVDRKKGKGIPFFWCTIWKDLPQARKRMREVSSVPDDPRITSAAGACYSWTLLDYKNGAKGDLLPEMGEIVLAESWVVTSTISHECSHAAFRYGERVKEFAIADEYEPEERHCLTVGYMARQIAKRMIALEARRKRLSAVQAGAADR